MTELLYSIANLTYNVDLHGMWNENNTVTNGILTFTHVDGEITKEEISGSILEIDAYVANKINL